MRPPRIFTRKSHRQPAEFPTPSAKRLLQQYLPVSETRARLSSECGLSTRSIWNIEKGLTARPLAKTQITICSTLEAAGIEFTIGDLPNLRSRNAAAWIAPAITTKFAVGDDVHFHPTAGSLIAAASGSYVVKGRMPEDGAGETYPHQAPNRAA